jgi:hypothetical protein
MLNVVPESAAGVRSAGHRNDSDRNRNTEQAFQQAGQLGDVVGLDDAPCGLVCQHQQIRIAVGSRVTASAAAVQPDRGYVIDPVAYGPDHLLVGKPSKQRAVDEAVVSERDPR